MNRPSSTQASGSRSNASGSNQPENLGARPTPSGATNALLQAANTAYAELKKHEAEEQRKREASETLVGLQWRYA